MFIFDISATSIGVLDTRSFLFFYDDDENKENLLKAAKKEAKVQRSNSDRVAPKKTFDSQKSVSKGTKQEIVKNDKNDKSKCPKIESLQTKSDKPKPKFQNKLFAKAKAQDDTIVPALQLKKKEGPLNPMAKPLKAALVNAKYVTWTRVTNDLAVLFFTCGETMF